MSVNFKIATYNLRCNTKHDQINMFDIRKGLVLDKIMKESPDIIGFQEMLPQMHEFLKRHLTGYTIVGRSRGADYNDEHVDIAFKNDTIELFGLDFFWLSPTPYVPGSRYLVQSPCPRITTSGMFKHKDIATPFRVYNTHLDHVGEPARVLGMTQILDKIARDNKKIELPVFLTGDMNAVPDSETIRMAANYLVDITTSIPESFHGFNEKYSGKIDYIFTDTETAKVPHTVKSWHECTFGVYLSDHDPISAEFIF